MDLQESESIRTDCVIDLLMNGLPLRQVTEIVGEHGVGKTQIGMHIATKTHTLYIDTEGDFMASRALELSDTCSLERINYIRTLDLTRLISVLESIPLFLDSNPQVIHFITLIN